MSAIRAKKTKAQSHYLNPYSLIAFSRKTIRANSNARSRVISPSFIIPVKASASACLAVVFESQATSGQSTSGPKENASVPNRTLSGYDSSQFRRISLNSRGYVKKVCAEKSAYTFGLLISDDISLVNG